MSNRDSSGSFHRSLRLWRRGFCLLVVACFFAATARAENEFDLTAQNLRGQTGNITAPSAKAMEYKTGSVGLHQFVMGFLYGWPRNVEFGTSFDLRDATPITPFTRKTYKERSPHINLHAKVQLLQKERAWIDGAIGVIRHTYYIALSPPTYFGFQFDGGPVYRRRSDGSHTAGFFSSVSYTFNVQKLMADFDPLERQAAVGWRYLLSDSIRLDLLLTQIGEPIYFFDRVIFGITIAG